MPQKRDADVGDRRSREAVRVGYGELLRLETFGRALDEFAGIGMRAERIDFERQRFPQRVAAKQALLGADVHVRAVGEPVGVGAGAGIRDEVADVGERRARRVGEAPRFLIRYRGGVEAIGGNNIAREGLPQHDVVSTGVFSAGAVAWNAADRVGIVDRNQRAITTAQVGEIARAHCLRGHAENQRSPHPLAVAFPVGHKKQLVANNRAAALDAVLVLDERRTVNTGAVVIERVGVELAVAQELVGRAPEIVATRAGRHVDDAARGASELRRKAVGLYLEFGDGILRGNQSKHVPVVKIQRGPIEVSLALVGGPAAYLKISRSERILAGGRTLRA